MSRRLRIPGLIDMLSLDTPLGIAEAAHNPQFDRRYEQRGPLFNRLIWRRIRRILQHEGQPLPPVAPRDDIDRKRHQEAAEQLFEGLEDQLDPGAVEAIAAFIRGTGANANAGRLAQQATGRAFVADYRADAESWSAATTLGAAPSSLNPFRRLYWALSGRIAKARDLLAAKVDGDPVALHATGIAVHNLADALLKMRALWADPAMRGGLPTAAAVARSLTAPDQVLRQPIEKGETAEGHRYGRNTLVRLRLQAARKHDPGSALSFMTGSWSACPARRWAPALLAAAWRGTTGEDGDGQ